MANRAELEGFDEMAGKLEELPALLQSQILERAMKRSLAPMRKAAQRFVTQPGYPGDIPGRRPLRATIQVKLRQYQRAWVAIVGPSWKRGGQHGHNVEHGHAPGGWNTSSERVPPHPYMEPAIAATQQAVEANFVNEVDREIQKAWASG